MNIFGRIHFKYIKPLQINRYETRNITQRIARPRKFQQMVVLSDGSTFTISTTSPKPIIWITKDQRNHPLWNPDKKRQIDESDNEGRLKKFKQKYGTTYDIV
ncbi:ribosomal protein L31 [Pneumocystis jirovecii RU7]|uniref:Ribosomal protein L31 n=1 Tax=Pneumocystis jirovecii (strain RU7) TaxID=1408657 RepID=A0A0W4ZRS2_PNEJ7|nr:ribosomal protein L31 [Pneumocystis jirovecii RU7]KTW31082.1 ribosomal protein L31 [Pneumocystis jirovecii RU7]